MNTLKGKKAVFCTLGCKLNFAETSTIQQQMEAAGAVIAHNGIGADICIVNTCSVTEVAESKCRQAISKLRRKNPGAMIVVTGCYAQLRPERVAALEGVDLVVGTKQKGDIINLIQNFSNTKETASCIEKQINEPFFPACACVDRTRFFLKVQDGCDYFCNYCTIPFARGRSRNGSIASLVKQAEDVVRQGGKEIILTGVNIGDFGRTTGEKFIDLILRKGLHRHIFRTAHHAQNRIVIDNTADGQTNDQNQNNCQCNQQALFVAAVIAFLRRLVATEIIEIIIICSPFLRHCILLSRFAAALLGLLL